MSEISKFVKDKIMEIDKTLSDEWIVTLNQKRHYLQGQLVALNDVLVKIIDIETKESGHE